MAGEHRAVLEAVDIPEAILALQPAPQFRYQDIIPNNDKQPSASLLSQNTSTRRARMLASLASPRKPYLEKRNSAGRFAILIVSPRSGTRKRGLKRLPDDRSNRIDASKMASRPTSSCI